MAASLIARPTEPAAGPRVSRRAVALLLAAVGGGSVAGFRLVAPDQAGEPGHAAHGAPVTTDGDTLRIVVPAGSFDQPDGLVHDLALPPTIRMRVGQTIEIRNDDRLTHVILGEAVPAHAVVRRVLVTPGIEVYAAGCAVHSVGLGMTSLIVAPEPTA